MLCFVCVFACFFCVVGEANKMGVGEEMGEGEYSDLPVILWQALYKNRELLWIPYEEKGWDLQ